MQLSNTDLRRLVREVDDQHHEAMADLGEQISDVHSRRHVLHRAGLGALTLTVGSVALPVGRLLSPALAQEEAKPLTDEELAGFAESLELAAVAGYSAALGSGKLKNIAV